MNKNTQISMKFVLSCLFFMEVQVASKHIRFNEGYNLSIKDHLISMDYYENVYFKMQIYNQQQQHHYLGDYTV